MNLLELAKMARRWPPETPAIIGRKDYGSETPVEPLRSRIWKSIQAQMADEANRYEALAVLGVCVIVGICLWTFFQVLPTAVDGLIDHSRQVVAESKGVER